MWSSERVSGSTGEGDPSIGHAADVVFGNAIVSRIECGRPSA